MKIRAKNMETRQLIRSLLRESYENKAMFWRAVARALNRPAKNQSKINLYHLEKHTKKNDTVLALGSVLGSGEIGKPITVAAMKFSCSAKEKIEKAGGKVISINDLLEKNPGGKGIKIIG